MIALHLTELHGQGNVALSSVRSGSDAVARYFFDVHDGELVTDAVGVECVDFNAVRQEAKIALQEMAQDILRDDGEQYTIRVMVRNQRDRIVYTATLTFSGQATRDRDRDRDEM